MRRFHGADIGGGVQTIAAVAVIIFLADRRGRAEIPGQAEVGNVVLGLMEIADVQACRRAQAQRQAGRETITAEFRPLRVRPRRCCCPSY